MSCKKKKKICWTTKKYLVILFRTLILEEYPEQNMKFLQEQNIKFLQFGIAGNKVKKKKKKIQVKNSLIYIIGTFCTK